MSVEISILLSISIPIIGAVLIAAAHNRPNLRETISLIISLALFGIVLTLLPEVLAGNRPSLTLVNITPTLPILFELEPLGMLFACIAALLWPINTLYSIGYMRGNQESHQTRFYICFAIALSSTMGVALAGNLLTLFIFYELLTLSTYPLVTHKGDEAALNAGRTYLGILMTTSIGFLLVAIIWTWSLTGSLEFRPGGILAGPAAGPELPL